jgi:hypothetical protein
MYYKTSWYINGTTNQGNKEEDVMGGAPATDIWYITFLPRLKFLFANDKEAKLMKWHDEERKTNVVTQSDLANACQWRETGLWFPDFGKDPHTKSIHSETWVTGTLMPFSMVALQAEVSSLSQTLSYYDNISTILNIYSKHNFMMDLMEIIWCFRH